MEYNAKNVEEIVTLFYKSEAAQQAQAHQALNDAQASPQAWNFVWELLQPNKNSEVQFFAASTLHSKILNHWKEIPVEQYGPLKEKILEAIITYAVGPKMVLNSLCKSFSTYLLHTVKSEWPETLNELVNFCQPANFPTVQPENISWILVEILTLIPEEFEIIMFAQIHKNEVKNNLQRVADDVVKLISSYFTVPLDQINSSHLTIFTNCARCLTGWVQLGGVLIVNCDSLMTCLIDVACHLYWRHQAECNDVDMDPEQIEVIEQVLESYTQAIVQASSRKYPTIVLAQLHVTVQKLSKIVENEKQADVENLDVLSPIYNLIMVFSEAHSGLLISCLFPDSDEQKQQLFLRVIYCVLACTDTKGSYSIDEEISSSAFGFWYNLQEEAFVSGPESGHVEHLKPFYRQLVEILLKKAMLPANDDDPRWNSEHREVFRCYRQDIADTMTYCFNVLGSELLQILQRKLSEAIERLGSGRVTAPDNWPLVESVLHSFFAIAEHFENKKNDHLPILFRVLYDIPYQNLHVKVLQTALDIIGAYSAWLNSSPDILRSLIRLILLGLQSREVAPNASLALKDISRDCHENLRPCAVEILVEIKTILGQNHLQYSEKVRLMFSVGKILSTLPLENIVEYLNLVLAPILTDIQSIMLSDQLTASAKNSLVYKLKMISMLFTTLDLSEEENEMSSKTTPTPTVQQPIVVVLERMLPLLDTIVKKYCQDVLIVEEVFSMAKHAATTLYTDFKPFVNDVLRITVYSYQMNPTPSALDLSKLLIILFGRDKECADTMRLLLFEIINVTLRLVQNQNLADFTDTLESFYNFLAQILKKNARLFAENLPPPLLMQNAILSLGLHEQPTVKATASFLVQLISISRDYQATVSLMHEFGPNVLSKLLLLIGGEAPRTGLDPYIDIILMLNKKYFDCLKRWLELILAVENFPSNRVTVYQKQEFIKAVMKEKVNRRKLQEVVREFSLICRGLINTEYANQTNPTRFL